MNDHSSTPFFNLGNITVLNDADGLDAFLAREITFALGASRQDRFWKSGKFTLGKVVEKFLSTHTIGQKDGPSITQGALVGSERKSVAVRQNSILMVDVDTGADMGETLHRIADMGLFCVAWTTHSHMKPTTEVSERAIVNFLKKQKISRDIEGDDVIAYLSEVKKYAPAIVESCVVANREHTPEGVKYLVEHDPMPRFRLMFVLSEPFDFVNTGTQQERIALWKQKYEWFSELLGVSWDSTCVDPARLMYLPRKSTPDMPSDIVIVNGTALDLDLVQEPELDALESAGRAMGREHGTIKSAAEELIPGITKWAGKHANTFAFADMLEAVEPENRRGNASIPGGWTHRCPNADGHSEGDNPDDKGFVCGNGEDNLNDTGFVAFCMHDTCKSESDSDRLWFLAKFMVENNLGLDDLIPYCPEWQEETNAAAEEERRVITLRERIMACPKNDIPAREALMREMAQAYTDIRWRVAITQLIVDKDIYNALGFTNQIVFKTVWNAMKQAARAEQIARATADGSMGHRVPDNPETARIIWKDWDHEDKVRVVAAVFKRKNKQKPQVYLNASGEPVYIVSTYSGIMFKPVDKGRWSVVLSGMMTFKTVNSQTGIESGVAPFADVVEDIASLARDALDLPVVASVTQVPIFGADGTLLKENGYDAANQVYIECPFKIRPVSDAPSEDEVGEAVQLLMGEAIRDFPFSDSFTGDDIAPVYQEERGADGHLIPNWERGHVSRLHAMLMPLTAFARNMIDGPCPAFHIDKATPATGAGFLTNVLAMILTGTEAAPETLPSNNLSEETRKKITTGLKNNRPIMFWDNINHKVDSADLASALTAGKWQDRLLGGNEEVSIPVRNIWVFAGNNLSFTHEMYRRMVPVRLDANMQNPQNRDPSMFKHAPLTEWLRQARPDLVWACHTLVQNWLAQGAPPGSGSLGTFENWARVMTGILEAAGLQGALSTIPAYVGTGDDEQHGYIEVAEFMTAVFKHEEFNAQAIADTMSAESDPEIAALLDLMGIKMRPGMSLSRSIGKWLNKHMVGQTYELPSGSRVKMTKRLLNGKSLYGFQPF